MMRNSVLIVEPDSRRRTALELHLALDFSVVSTRSIAEAFEAFPTLRPDILIANLRQETGNGLKLCKVLRMNHFGKSCVMVVYGRPHRRLRSREEIERRWEVDVFVPVEVEPDVMAPLIWRELTRRAITRREAIAPSWSRPPAVTTENVALARSREGSRPVTGWRAHFRAVTRFLNREFYLFKAPRRGESVSLSELSWFELLNSRISFSQLQELAKRAQLRSASG